MSVSTSTTTTSTAVVLYQAPIKTPEQIQFERTKQAVLNRSLAWQKQAVNLNLSYERSLQPIKPELASLPAPILNKTFEYLSLREAPAVAGTCKALQLAMGSHLVNNFNKDSLPFDWKERKIFLKCGMRISAAEVMCRVWGVNDEYLLKETVSEYLNPKRPLEKTWC